MRTIRASEISTYWYCQRAWWFQLNGYETDKLDQLADGLELHQQHGRRVVSIGCMRFVAYALLLLGLVLLAVQIAMQLLSHI